jgi:hypothetical protein
MTLQAMREPPGRECRQELQNQVNVTFQSASPPTALTLPLKSGTFGMSRSAARQRRYMSRRLAGRGMTFVAIPIQLNRKAA